MPSPCAYITSTAGRLPITCLRKEGQPSTPGDGFHKKPSSRGKRPHRASSKGAMFNSKNRRKGRPAVTRNPYDSPLRDGNRDRLMGLLTTSALRTLIYYLSETNVTVCHWLNAYSLAHPIPKKGNWDDVSGEVFIRKLLTLPVEDASAALGRESLFNYSRGIEVDPRSLAQRILEIRAHLARESIQDLQAVSEENSNLLRESLSLSLLGSVDDSDESMDSLSD